MTAVGAYAKKVPVAHAVVAAAELVANSISVAERIDDVMPVGSLEDERLAVFKLPLEELGAHAPPWIEVNVFDSTNIVNPIDEDSAAQRLTVNVSDESAFVFRSVDSVVRIKELDVEDGRVLTAHLNCPRVRDWNVVDLLVRPVKNDALQDAIGVERDESARALVASAPGYEERRPVVRRFRKAAVAIPIVRRYGIPRTAQRYALRNIERAAETVSALRNFDDPALGTERIERLLERGSLVRDPVSYRAEVANVDAGAPVGRRGNISVFVDPVCAADDERKGGNDRKKKRFHENVLVSDKGETI